MKTTSRQAASKLQGILAKKKNLFLAEMDIKQDHIFWMLSELSSSLTKRKAMNI